LAYPRKRRKIGRLFGDDRTAEQLERIEDLFERRFDDLSVALERRIDRRLRAIESENEDSETDGEEDAEKEAKPSKKPG